MAPSSRIPPILATEIPQWLEQWKFDEFITLATNDSALPLKGHSSSEARMRDLLKEWEGRMHRKMVGPDWQKRIADRMWCFYFLEKPEFNPHWHGLVQFSKYYPTTREEQKACFRKYAEPIWKKLVPTGSVSIIPVYIQKGLSEYLAKELGNSISYENYVVPDEF